MVGVADEMLPDRGAEAAQQALRAAADLRVFDGRATAWLVVQRLLEVAGMAMLLGGTAFGSVLVGQWVWIVAGAGLLFLVWEGPVGRRAGAEPRRWPFRRRLAVVAALVAAIVVVGIVTYDSPDTGSRPLLAGVAVVAVCYLLAPVVRWLWALRRPRGTTRWPDGAQGYAVLAVLARVQWMHPDRLAELTGLPREHCDEWVAACSARGLVVPPGRHWGLRRNTEISASGRTRLDAWTAELTARAVGSAPAAASAAGTNGGAPRHPVP